MMMMMMMMMKEYSATRLTRTAAMEDKSKSTLRTTFMYLYYFVLHVQEVQLKYISSVLIKNRGTETNMYSILSVSVQII